MLSTLTATAIVVIAIASVRVGAYAWLASEKEAYPATAEASAKTVQDNSRGRLEVELITLRPTGFEPNALTRSRGRFLLALDNRSRAAEVDIQLTSMNGERVAAKRMKMRELRWRQVIDLPAGQYVLSEANNAEWRCEIIISP